MESQGGASGQLRLFDDGLLTENDPAKLEFGQQVELTKVPFATDADGDEIVTFAFQPV